MTVLAIKIPWCLLVKNWLFKTAALLALLFLACPLNSSFSSEANEPSIKEALNKAREVGVTEEVLSKLVTLSHDYGLHAQPTVIFINIIIDVRKKKLPGDDFVDKIEEGLSKSVPTQKIETALIRKMDNYIFARQTLVAMHSPNMENIIISPSDQASLVGALELGLTRQELIDFLEQAPSAPLEMVLQASEYLAFFKQLGFNMKYARQILFMGLAKNSLTGKWRYLPQATAAARQKGLKDSEIAKVYIEVLNNKGDLREAMNKMGFTKRNMRLGPAKGRTTGSPRR